MEGGIQLAVTVEDDPGRDLGEERQIGHRFFFSPEEVEPLPGMAPPRTKRILVAGIGNVFMGDDGFGVEVAGALLRASFRTACTWRTTASAAWTWPSPSGSTTSRSSSTPRRAAAAEDALRDPAGPRRSGRRGARSAQDGPGQGPGAGGSAGRSAPAGAGGGRSRPPRMTGERTRSSPS